MCDPNQLESAILNLAINARDAMLIANRGVQDVVRAQEVLAAGADIVALGRVALANPDFPNRVRAAQEVAAFDAAILGPIANIKPSELAV